MRTRHASLFVSLSLALGLPAAGCGSLEGNTDQSPALATLRGNIVDTSTSPPPAGSVRVAVVWRALLPGQFDVAEDLPVSAVSFPASFQIELDVPPPSTAMMSGQEVVQLFEPQLLGGPSDCTPGVPCTPDASPPTSFDFQVAGGVVVAYLDKNGNGKLDLVASGAGDYVDEIIGTNDLWLVYFQGSLPTASEIDASGTPTLGYNLYRHADCSGSIALPPTATRDAAAPTSGDASPDAGVVALPTGGSDGGASCTTNNFLPIDTLYTLTVSGQPQGSSLMCKDPTSTIYDNVYEPDGAVPPGGYPVEGQAGFGCGPIEGVNDGSYTLTSCTHPTSGLCQQDVCVVDQYPQPSPIPAGWPCTTLGSGPPPVGGNGSK